MAATMPNATACLQGGEADIQRLPVDSEEYKVNDWTFKYTKSHILHSQCSTADKCANSQLETCQFCIFTNTLQLPHLPEMVFPNNVLTLIHASGAKLEFSALEALKLVSNGKNAIKIACSEAWKETRSPDHMEEKLKPFDWTFSTEYKGNLSGSVSAVPTEERIDMAKLKEREKILFYHEMMLYEDELHDNGISSCTIKIRVMPSSFFVLLRFFLRVDNVMVRVNDTRLFHDFTKDYLIREYSNRESGFRELGLPLPMFADPNLISPHLPLRTSIIEKLFWNNSCADSESLDNESATTSCSS